MTEENIISDSNTKTQLSLAAALFFSPLVQHMLTTNKRDINETERDFIRWYIKIGYVTLALAILAIASWVMNYLYPLSILSITYTISIFILIFLLLISIVSILSDISLVKWWSLAFHTSSVEGNRKDILLKYLPAYDIYLRYASHSFEKPNRWIKESIILWTLFGIVCLSGNIFLSSTLLILIIVRIASLMSDIDFLSIPIKQQLNKIFVKNPEEFFWYITWFISYIGKSITHTFISMQPYTLASEIHREIEVYSRIIDLQGTTSIIIEYIIWILLAIWMTMVISPDFTVRTYYAALWLLIARYAVMGLQLKHLPHLPVARELLLLFMTIISFFRKRFFIHN